MGRLGRRAAAWATVLAVPALALGVDVPVATGSPSGAVYSTTGTISLSPALGASPSAGSTTGQLTLHLANTGAAGPSSGTLSGSVTIGGGCLSGSGGGSGTITWADGSVSALTLTIQMVGPAVQIQGFVDLGPFANAQPQGALAFSVDEPAACAGTGVTSAGLTGALALPVPS